MQKDVNDVLEFHGIIVTRLKLHDHLRKWRMRWNKIWRIGEQRGIRLCNDNTCFQINDDKKLRQHLMLR
jgi:histone deacetylase complex regulatory component SIN3